MAKASASREIDVNREPSLARVEIDCLHKPWSLDAKGRLKQLVGHQGCSPPSARPAVSPSRVPPTPALPPRQSAPARREEAPPTTPQERHNSKTVYRCI